MRLSARCRLGIGVAAAAAAVPAVVSAAGTAVPHSAGVAVDTVWVVIAATFVLFMQAGFAMLEVGFTRMKNVGTVVAKIVVNLAISSVMYWAVGFAFAFGVGSGFLGHLIGWGSGFAPSFLPGSTLHLPALAGSDVPPAAKLFFEFVFCAISLAIVWGTMLERTKFIVYILFAIPFAGFIYPLISHWVWGGGWLASLGAQDFAGSAVVHLTGATAGFAGLLLLGPRIGKYGRDGQPNAIPGHSMPLAQLGVLILWFGWFGFNPGSTLQALNLHFADVVVVTNLAAAAGALSAMTTMYLRQRSLDVGMIGNGAIAGLAAITAPSGFVQPWAALIIGAVAGVIVVFGVLLVDRYLDDPIGALSAHGLACVWGVLSCGLFADPALARFNAVGRGGLVYTGSFTQLGVQAVTVVSVVSTVFAVSFGLFWALKRTVGLRVSERYEIDGLDISEHGMWGYPEQFMPVPGGAYIHPDAVALARRHRAAAPAVEPERA